MSVIWRAGVVAALAAGLGGCGTPLTSFGPTAPPIPKPSEVSQDITTLNTNIGTNLVGYVGAGYYRSYEACSHYFDFLIQIQNETRYASDVTTAAGVATTTLIALRTNAATAARLVSKYAAGFALATTVIDKFDDRALMTPYPGETKTLILNAMQAYENLNPPEKARTQAEAASFVSGYAEMCTYSGITRYAKQALNNATPKADDAATLSGRDLGYMQAIVAAMGKPGTALTIRQLAILDFLINEDTAALQDTGHTDAALAELPNAIASLFTKDGSGKYQAPAASPAWPLLKGFAESSTDVQTQLADLKESWSKPIVKGAPAVVAAAGKPAVPATPDTLTRALTPTNAGRKQVRF